MIERTYYPSLNSDAYKSKDVLFYIEYIPIEGDEITRWKLYKRHFFEENGYEKYIFSQSEGHPYVLYEGIVNNSSLSINNSKTHQFMVDAMNEKYLKSKNS
jgi:hypothetical protein